MQPARIIGGARALSRSMRLAEPETASAVTQGPDTLLNIPKGGLLERRSGRQRQRSCR